MPVRLQNRTGISRRITWILLIRNFRDYYICIYMQIYLKQNRRFTLHTDEKGGKFHEYQESYPSPARLFSRCRTAVFRLQSNASRHFLLAAGGHIHPRAKRVRILRRNCGSAFGGIGTKSHHAKHSLWAGHGLLCRKRVL